jgi:hypothetical protein
VAALKRVLQEVRWQLNSSLSKCAKPEAAAAAAAAVFVGHQVAALKRVLQGVREAHARECEEVIASSSRQGKEFWVATAAAAAAALVLRV